MSDRPAQVMERLRQHLTQDKLRSLETELKNIDISALTDDEGRTLLMHAVSDGKLDAVNLFLRYLTPADVNQRDRVGRTALHYAAARVISGVTPMGIAASTNAGTPMPTAIAILETLIEKGNASPAIPNTARVTVLQLIQEAPEPLRADPRIAKLFPKLTDKSPTSYLQAQQQQQYQQHLQGQPVLHVPGQASPDVKPQHSHLEPSHFAATSAGKPSQAEILASLTSTPSLFTFPREPAQSHNIWQVRTRYGLANSTSEAKGGGAEANENHNATQDTDSQSFPRLGSPYRKARGTTQDPLFNNHEGQMNTGSSTVGNSNLRDFLDSRSETPQLTASTARSWTTIPYTPDPDENRLHTMLSKVHPDFADYLTVFEMLKKFRAQKEQRERQVQGNTNDQSDADHKDENIDVAASQKPSSTPGNDRQAHLMSTSTAAVFLDETRRHDHRKDSVTTLDGYESDYPRGRKEDQQRKYLSPEDLMPLFNFIRGLDANGRAINNAQRGSGAGTIRTPRYKSGSLSARSAGSGHPNELQTPWSTSWDDRSFEESEAEVKALPLARSASGQLQNAWKLGEGTSFASPAAGPRDDAEADVVGDMHTIPHVRESNPSTSMHQSISEEDIRDVLDLIDISRDGKVDAQDFWLAMTAPFVPRNPQDEIEEGELANAQRISGYQDAFEGVEGLDDTASAAIAANRLSESGLSVPEIVAALAHDRAVKRAAAAEADQTHTVDVPFSLFDRDGDGLISVDDLRHVRTLLGSNLFPLLTSTEMSSALEVLSAGFNYTYGAGGGSGMSIHCTAPQTPASALAASTSMLPPPGRLGGMGGHGGKAQLSDIHDRRYGADSPVVPVPEPTLLPTYALSPFSDTLSRSGSDSNGLAPTWGTGQTARRLSRLGLEPGAQMSFCTKAAFGALARSQIPVLAPAALESKNSMFFLAPETAIKARMSPAVSSGLPPTQPLRREGTRRGLGVDHQRGSVVGAMSPTDPESTTAQPNPGQQPSGGIGLRGAGAASLSGATTPGSPGGYSARSGALPRGGNSNPYRSNRRRSITTPESSLAFGSLAEVGLPYGAGANSGTAATHARRSSINSSRPLDTNAANVANLNLNVTAPSSATTPSFGDWISRRASIGRAGWARSDAGKPNSSSDTHTGSAALFDSTLPAPGATTTTAEFARLEAQVAEAIYSHPKNSQTTRSTKSYSLKNLKGVSYPSK